eukprot:7582790-Ditylum_brightwellii.AAC.1
MVTTQTLTVNLSKLPEEAKCSFRMLNINNNLLSVTELCDADCTITFSKNDVVVEKNDKQLLQGWRDTSNQLWRVTLEEKYDKQGQYTTHMKHDNCNNIIY